MDSYNGAAPPRGSIREIRFAEPSDGWAWGPGLWSTHDGGSTWRQVPITGSVVSLEPYTGGVYAVIVDCPYFGEGGCPNAPELFRSPTTRDAFVRDQDLSVGELESFDAARPGFEEA